MSPAERVTRAHRPRGGRAEERGTSTLEVAALAPLIVFFTLVLLYVAFAVYGISATQTAARQAARAESLGQDPVEAADRALPGWLPRRVSVSSTGRVTVQTNLPDLLPGTDLLVSRDAVMP